MIGVVLLPQLLFFWLAPQDAAARWAVYIVGTVLTFLLTCMSFGVCWYVGVRRGAAPLTTGLEELEPGGPRPAPDPAEQTLPPCGGSVPLPPRRR